MAPDVFNNPLGAHQPRQRPGAWPFHFDQNGNIVFPHPFAWNLAPNNTNANAGFSMAGAAAPADGAARMWPVRTAAAAPSAPSPAPAQPAPKTNNTKAQYQVSQAAQQLRNQIDESKAVFDKFHSDYREDVEKVKDYASDGVLPRLWADKIRQNKKMDDGQENDQLLYQRDKLATCLKRMVEATALSSSATVDYDSRELHFEKIRVAGARMNRLCKKALGSEKACKDLIDELDELSGLIGPESRAAAVLYRFNKGEKAAEPLSSGDEQEEANATGDDNADKENQNNDEYYGASAQEDNAADDLSYGGGGETNWNN